MKNHSTSIHHMEGSIVKKTWTSIVCGGLCALIILFSPGAAYSQTSVWATAYYAGWQQGSSNKGRLPAQDIDYSAVTHIVHFSLVPNANGTVDPNPNSIT